MSINQLFINKPNKELIGNLLNLFGYNIDNIDTQLKFTKTELLNSNIIDKFNNIKDELKENYISCKKNIYFNEININKIITILRQHIKLIDYKLESIIKYINSKKIIYYKIFNYNKIKTNNNINIITFD